MKFTEIYYEDAERLARHISERDGKEVEIIRESSTDFPLPPKRKWLPNEVDAFIVGDYEIAYLEMGPRKESDKKYHNRCLHRVMAGERLRALRMKCGKSLQELEDLTGLKARNIDGIETGRYDASVDVLANIGEALGYHLDFVKD